MIKTSIIKLQYREVNAGGKMFKICLPFCSIRLCNERTTLIM